MSTFFTIIVTVIMGWFQALLPANEIIVTSSTEAEITAINCELSANSGMAVNLDKGIELCIKEPDEVRSIASLTKLMSVLVFLDHDIDWETIYRIRPDDRREGGRIYLFSGDEVTVRDLFYNALIASDNTAIIGLVNLTGLTESEFTFAMNQKAQELGLAQTHFVEPTGLNSLNISTAREVAVFASLALGNDYVHQAALNTQHTFTTQQGKTRTVYSTGQPLASQSHGLEYLGGKTGYLMDSGYCFVGLFSNDEDDKIITVVLGADNKEERFNQTAIMLQACSVVNKLN